MATTFTHGNNFRLYNLPSAPSDVAAITAAELTAGTGIACAKSANLSMTITQDDITCQGNTSGAGYQHFIPGQKGWTMSAELLYVVDTEDTDATDLQALADAGTKLYAILGDGVTGNKYYYGEVYISSVDVATTAGDRVAYSVSFQGTGELTYGTFAA